MWTKQVLVVANLTALSDELVAALEARGASIQRCFI